MIRHATSRDLKAIAAINRTSFSGNKPKGTAERWVKSHFEQGAQYHYVVDVKNGVVRAFIGWELKGGFARETPALELEQLAVHEDFRGKGIGQKIVEASFKKMKTWLTKHQPEAQSVRVFVWAKDENGYARKIYTRLCDSIAGERTLYGVKEVMYVGLHRL